MNLALPAGLWLGLIAIPLVAFYLLRIKRHRRTVPYLRLWAELVGERHFNTLFQRLQRWLSLLLQLLIGACLVLAFASLTLSESFLEEESFVLVVDTSASMSGRETPDGARTRFDAAVERARELVEGRSAEDEFAVVAAGAQPEVLQGFTRSTLRLRDAVDLLRPTRAVGDLDGAVRLARDLLQGKPAPRVVLLADAAGGAAPRLAGTDDVRWSPIGSSVPNVSVRRFQMRRNFGLGTDYLLLVVANESDHDVHVDAEIRLGDRLRMVEPLDLAPREVRSTSRNLAGSLPQGGFAKVTLVHAERSDGTRPGDGLALDDVAFAVLQPARAYRVLLVARDDAEEEPFRAVLEAMDTLIDRDATAATRPDGFAQLSPEQIAGYDLVLFVNQAPESLPASGRFFAVNALPGGLPARVVGVESAPEFREIDGEHPLNRFLQGKGLQPREARPLDLTGGTPFLSTGAGPVGVVFETPTRKVIYLGVDVLSDLFFLQVAFPLVLRNAIAWLHEESADLLAPTLRPGEVLRPRFPLSEPEVVVRWQHEWLDATIASGQRVVPVRDGRFHFAETAEPGRYWVATGGGEFRCAVNLFDAGESDLTMPDADPAARVEERAGFLLGRDLWPLLALAAFALWLGEWCSYHRRLTQ